MTRKFKSNLYKKSRFIIYLLLLIPFQLISQSYNKGKIANTEYSTFDVPVYTINAVTDFNADNTGMSDASLEIQAALNEAKKEYGGIVFLPKGNYLIENPIKIPKQVTLRGDWKKPNDLDKTVKGTVLHINHGDGTLDAAIELSDYSMIRDMSIYYPQQDLASTPIEYPYTIEGLGVFCSVRNITLVNPYKGIRYEPQNGQSVKFPTIIGVYGTPISNGIYIHQTSATPRVADVHFAPDYWSLSGLNNITNQKIKTSIHSINGTAILSGKGAGGGLFIGLSINGYDTAIRTTDIASPRVFDINISNCRIGIDFDQTKDHGWVITGGNIHATDTTIKAHKEAVNIQFNNITFRSDNQLINHQTGTLGFTKCSFNDWNLGSAIESQSGYLSVVGCNFKQSTTDHIFIGEDVERAVIYSNELKDGNLDIINLSNNDSNQIVIDTTSIHDFVQIDRIDYPFQNKQLQVPTPTAGESHIFTVTEFGAIGNGIIDDTQAFQNALDSAGIIANASAGCVVFIPTGVYRLESGITVPEHVELRGMNDNPTNGYGRSILALFANKGNPAGESDIVLNANSGMKSIYLYRPEQTWNQLTGDTTLHEYPYAIKGTNKNWAYNIVLSNIYDGIDFSSGGGHHMEFIFGCSINQIVKIGSGLSKLSIIENFQAKTEAWRNAKKMKFPAWENTSWSGPIGNEIGKLDSIGNGILINGNGQFRFMGHFINRTGDNLYTINGSPTLNMYLCGGEGEGNGSLINSEDGANFDIEMVGNSYHTMGATYTTSHTDSGDRLHVINCKNYGDASINHHMMGSGQIVMQQEYRGRNHEITLKLEGSSRGIIEGGYLEKGAPTRIRTLDESCAKICGAITIRPDWPFKAEDEHQISVESVSPAFITGISGNGIGCKPIIEPESKPSPIILYPNPTSSSFTIDLGVELDYSKIKVDIYDVTGRLIRSQTNQKGRFMELTLDAAASIYFVVIDTENESTTIPVIKTN